MNPNLDVQEAQDTTRFLTIGGVLVIAFVLVFFLLNRFSKDPES